ncbi:MAG: transketolase [Candidatus Aceula meridiana]|nr:transketolase [Candidatus Aceula meridiana]
MGIKIKNERLKKLSVQAAKKKADFVRRDLLRVCIQNKAGHIAPSLSCVDILVALYYQVMSLSSDPTWEGRDRLVFSKAHGCYGLYAILSDFGYISQKEWKSFYKKSSLTGCVERDLSRGLEMSCGSLGHGLPQAVGIAFGAKLQKKKYHVYCIVGDGEMQEGSNWEAIQAAAKFGLTNLTIIVDHNRLQAMDFLENVLTLKGRKNDLQQKIKGFGLEVKTCSGHSLSEMTSIFKQWRKNMGKAKTPRVLISKTIKGHGLKCMENVPKFHFRVPTQKELEMGNCCEG